MPILDMRAATFGREQTIVAPVTITLDQGERSDITCETDLAASVLARLAAGIIKCTTGIVFVGNFDPKIQPVQVKRLIGFMPHECAAALPDADAYFAYRAALWEIDKHRALERGAALLKRFDGLPEREALMLAGALLHSPRLVVLDRPSAFARSAAAAAASDVALFASYGPADRVIEFATSPLEMATR